MDYELGLYEKALPDLAWHEKLEATKVAGFDYLEISIDESEAKLARLKWTTSERNALLQTMNNVGLPIRSMCLSGHRKYPLGATDPTIRTRSLEILHDALELSNHLGIRYIQLAGYDVYYEPSTPETRAWFAQNLQQAVSMANKAGVVLAFETMETPFMNTVCKSLNYVHQINSPYLQIYPDVGNLKNASSQTGVSLEEDLRLGAGHLIAAHLKETRPDVFREVPFGTGHVDFRAATQTLWELGVRRFVAEMWFVGANNWQAELQHANAFVRQYFQQVYH
jgi:L-ribulose-5-phosphate 3-epimerase